MRLLILAAIACWSVPGTAQQIGNNNYRVQDVKWYWQFNQQVGVPLLATAGTAIVERVKLGSFTTANIVERFRDLGGFMGVTLESPQDMVVTKDGNAIQACGFARYYRYCAIDKDGDGQFEAGLVQYSQSSPELTPVTLKKPIPYGRIREKTVLPPEGNFRQELVYLGFSNGTLRLAYREFINDQARPAFTDEITFTLSGKGQPEEIAYKDIVIEVQAVSNAGIRYVIKKVGAGAASATAQ